MASLDTTCLDQLSAEAAISRDEVAKVLEGFEDYLRLNILPDSSNQLEVLRSRYTTRLNKSANAVKALAEAKAAIGILKADGHPDEPEAIVDREVIEDMDKNLDTLLAARRRFTPRAITKMGKLIVGDQERA